MPDLEYTSVRGVSELFGGHSRDAAAFAEQLRLKGTTWWAMSDLDYTSVRGVSELLGLFGRVLPHLLINCILKGPLGGQCPT